MNTETHASTFDSWLGQMSPADLERELGELRRRFAAKLQQYEVLGKELQKLDTEMERRLRFLELLREVQPEEPRNPQPEKKASEGQEPAPDSGAKMTKRRMAERILRGALKPLYPREVRDIAVERGWLADTPNAANQLSVAMNRAARAGVLAKDEEGRYSIPRQDADTENSAPDPQNLLIVSPGGGDRP